jgi:DNA-binding NtrC family response regulator
MFLTLGQPLSLKQISFQETNVVRLRPLLTIAIIDDEKFRYTDILKQHKFDITELGDISDTKVVSEYAIVCCDIRGVGKKFGSNDEGGYLIKEIKRRYPDKYVIVYSGSGFSDPTFKRFLDECDDSIKKDADIERWVETLDSAVERLGILLVAGFDYARFF